VSQAKASLKDLPQELVLTLGRLALERKAQDLVVLDLRKLNAFTDFMIILSGRSTRQVQAIAEHLLRRAKGLGVRPLGREGLKRAQWVLLDFGEVVVHIFLADLRNYYDLEGLWSDAALLEWPEEGPEPLIPAHPKERD
jgi:ribosome-associated protein